MKNFIFDLYAKLPSTSDLYAKLPSWPKNAPNSETLKQNSETLEQNSETLKQNLETLEQIFQIFNNNPASFKEVITASLASPKEHQKEAIDVLDKALKHFANKNADKKLSKDQIDMLKNNNAFMRFVGWICSMLPELLQVSVVANCTNRYHVSRFEKENLQAKGATTAVVA